MGKWAGWIRAGLVLACFLLLLPGAVRAEEAAEELTGRCIFTFTGSGKKQESLLTDGRTANSSRLEAKDRLIVRAPSDMGTLVLRLSKKESAFVLVEQDALGLPLGVRTVRTTAYSLNISLPSGCRQVELFPLEDHLRIAEINVFGPGDPSDTVPHLEPAVDKADFLLVSTHPDDEWVFLGGVYPLYGGERGLVGSVVYMTFPVGSGPTKALTACGWGASAPIPSFWASRTSTRARRRSCGRAASRRT